MKPAAYERRLTIGGRPYRYFSLEAGFGDTTRLPVSIKILLENYLRHIEAQDATIDDLRGTLARDGAGGRRPEISFFPGRLLGHDAAGITILQDLAALREAVGNHGGDPALVNPSIPVDLVIDHSLVVEASGRPDAEAINRRQEIQRNRERYTFLEWGRRAFANLKIIPPGNGICHQLNLEHIASVVTVSERGGDPLIFPDTCIGADSHTPMINALGVLGWGVGAIEAEAAALGEPCRLPIPEVVGVRLTGRMGVGVTATDVVLAMTRRLREQGVSGRFVEFCGPGLAELSVPDRATLANMAPEYGSTSALFPIDAETLSYLRLTGRDVALVEAYAEVQGLWSGEHAPLPDFDDLIDFDLGHVRPALAGPSRPDELAPLPEVPARFRAALPGLRTASAGPSEPAPPLGDGIVALAAITSCTNTSNPALLIGAGLLARNAVERGLKPKPWVKTSLSPGSRVVADYLAAGLQPYLDQLGFHITGFGCGTCLGNSGPLSDDVEAAIEKSGLVAVSVLSGNRNFERRVHQLLRANFLASPPLVVAYALAGTVGVDLEKEPLGADDRGRPVFLREIWPSASEVADLVARNVRRDLYTRRYGSPFEEAAEWKALDPKGGLLYAWDDNDSVVRRVPFLDRASPSLPPLKDIRGARALAILGDDVSTDFITPAGRIGADSPAGRHLASAGVAPADFSTYSARRGNADLVARSTLAHPRLANAMHPAGGGFTRHWPSGETMTVFDAGMRYTSEGTPTIILAGRNYGLGSARDSAAKGPWLIGVRALIAESFERIHRANLIGMGILPLLLPEGTRLSELSLDGSEQLDILGLAGPLTPRGAAELRVSFASGKTRSVGIRLAIETTLELDYFRHGGVLPYSLRRLLAATGQRTGARH